VPKELEEKFITIIKKKRKNGDFLFFVKDFTIQFRVSFLTFFPSNHQIFSAKLHPIVEVRWIISRLELICSLIVFLKI
jgi:hypothetical protein